MTSIGSLRTYAARLGLTSFLVVGGCYAAHQQDRDGGIQPGTDASPMLEDGGGPHPRVCGFRPGAEIFDVIALTTGRDSVPRAIDGEGRIYGMMDADGGAGQRAFRWDPRTGLESLDAALALPPGTIVGIGDVTSEGAIAGTLRAGAAAHAFAWTPDGGLVDLSLEEEPSTAAAFAPDGSVLVNSEHRASLRVQSAMLPLGLPPGSDPRAVWIEGLDIAASGDVVGSIAFDRTIDVWRAFRRMPDLGYELLETRGAARSRALAISDDGRIIVGGASSTTTGATRPVMWIDGALMILPLLDLPGIARGEASDVSASGAIAGSDTGSSGAEPSFGWLRVGIRKIALDALLVTDGWHVLTALVLTDDHEVLAIARRTGSSFAEAVLLSPRCELEPML